MALKLIIDSTCDLPKWIIEKFDIQVLPLIVTLEDQVYRDGIDIQLNEVYQAMKNGIVPKTSQVSPESVYQVFTDNCEAGHDFIYVALSKELSGTYQTASMIANEIKEKYPERQLTVIDSKGGSMATGLIVLQAGLLIEKGADYKEVRDYINQAANHVEHIFTISNMEWLAKGGRIPKAVGKVGNLLNIKPLLEVKEGKISLMQMVRGRKKHCGQLLKR